MVESWRKLRPVSKLKTVLELCDAQKLVRGKVAAGTDAKIGQGQTWRPGPGTRYARTAKVGFELSFADPTDAVIDDVKFDEIGDGRKMCWRSAKEEVWCFEKL